MNKVIFIASNKFFLWFRSCYLLQKLPGYVAADTHKQISVGFRSITRTKMSNERPLYFCSTQCTFISITDYGGVFHLALGSAINTSASQSGI
jgi:hypothetical protein